MRHVGSWRRVVVVGLALALAAGACWGGEGDDEGASGRRTDGPFALRLSAGEPIGARARPVAVVPGQELSAEETEAIVSRLPALVPEGQDDPDDTFRRPPEPLPRPRVGRTVEQRFGAERPAPAPRPDPGPVEVLRHQPEGRVDVAPFVSVTFDQPMVAVGTLDQLDEEDVPVTIDPPVEGRWRWIGTRTLRFDPAVDGIDRMPGATEYRVEAPAGTRSAAGTELRDAVRWSFITPPPELRSLVPDVEVIDTHPVFVLTFDQRVDPEAVLETTTLTAGDERQGLRLASEEEIDADEPARQQTKRANPRRWVAFRTEEPLPTDTPVVIDVGPGTPSAEGPATTDGATTRRTKTYPPLRISERECGFGRACRVDDPFVLHFTNPIDPETFRPEDVRIDPPVGTSVTLHRTQVVIQAATRPDQTYEVTLPEGIHDQFGQPLEGDRTARFEVGQARPFLREFPDRVVTLDPFADDPVVAVTSAGQGALHVTLHAVGPDDHEQFHAWFDSRSSHDPTTAVPPWPVTQRTTIEVAGDAGEVSETPIDLSAALPGGLGHVVVVVEPTKDFSDQEEAHWESLPTVTWVQRTGIGIDAVSDHDRLVAWVTDLRDGAPVPSASVQLQGAAPVTTDERGLADLRLGSPARVLVARRGDDSAVLAPTYGSWSASPVQDAARWAVFDDRGAYRPGERLRLKGWLRRLALTEDAGLSPATGQVRYIVRDAFGNELGTGRVLLSAAGGFDLAVDLPAGAALGDAAVELVHDGLVSRLHHPFLIEDFRRPEVEVVTNAESPSPHVVTRPVTLRTEASYFAGGTVGDAPVTWRVTHTPTSYAPPNRPTFSFGPWREPWWAFETGDAYSDTGEGPFVGDTDFAPDPFGCCPTPDQEVKTYRSRTDATGADFLRLEFEGAAPDEPLLVSANSAIQDVNRQETASTTDLLVHPAELYVGLRSARTFVRSGETLDVEAIVTAIDGRAVAGRDLRVTAARVVEDHTGDEASERALDEQECGVTSGEDPVECSFETSVGGRYRITAVVTDDEGGRSRTELVRWVAGANDVPVRTVEEETATVVPSAEQYQPGDVAELLVISPFGPAHGLLTVRRHGIEETRTFRIGEASSTVLEVPITEGSTPGLEVSVDLAGSARRTRDDGTTSDDLPPRPAFATGGAFLEVTPTSKTLDVRAVPRDTALEPGGETLVDVAVHGPDGQGVAEAEVAVVVVDEAILSLTGYELPDPVSAIHQPVIAALRAERSRRTLQLADPERFGVTEAPATTVVGEVVRPGASPDNAAGGGGGGDEFALADSDGGAPVDLQRAGPASRTRSHTIEIQTPIDVRSDFATLAVFVADATTDSQGNLSIPVALPDNLTRYRVMAVAADRGDRFGAGEAAITARLPLMVRPSPPRFANFGDRFELPVVVQNQGDEGIEVAVVVEVDGLTLTGGAGRVVRVPADDRVEVRFPVAVEDVGTARFRVTAISGDLEDSASGELPAYTPATTESFATYGVVDDGGAVGQPMLAPAGVYPQFGGLEIDTSSTSLQALTDAVVYLTDYPYESADAYASRLVALVSLRDVFAAFAVPGAPSTADLDARVEADIAALLALQAEGGGFRTWPDGPRSDPHVSVQAAEALVAAAQAGYQVDPARRDAVLAHLSVIEQHFPPGWPASARRAVAAQALSVRAAAGDRDPAKAEELYRSATDLPTDAVAWLWPVVDDPAIRASIERTFADRVVETPSAATFTTEHEEGAEALVLASDRRTDGIVLRALISQQPQSDLIPKVVAGLVGNQVKGRWSNVQENGQILLALKRYFDTFESETPSFVARAWLGESHVSEHGHQGRSIDTQRTLVPIGELTGEELVLAKDGPGRLYYRLGLRYAPEDLQLEARDEGFVVERSYEAIDDPDDVRRGEDGRWHIAPGATVRVRLSMVADAARTNMALVDPLPAGLEIVNPALATSPRPPAERRGDDGGAGDVSPVWGGWSWFDHQQGRSDRAEAFASYLPAGTYDYTYVARATTPGTFVVPPAKAEEIYAPEVFGRSASATVVIDG